MAWRYSALSATLLGKSVMIAQVSDPYLHKCSSWLARLPHSGMTLGAYGRLEALEAELVPSFLPNAPGGT